MYARIVEKDFMTDDSINGLILTGGKSSRMGNNKAHISYHGKPQHEYLFELLTPFCDKVYTSCKAIDDFSERFNSLADQFDFESPLNGIASAIQKDSTKAWLSVPVDMPLINEEVIQLLVENRNADKVATCFLDSTGKSPEPLLAIWEIHGFDRLLDYQKRGGISPKEFLTQHEPNRLIIPHPKYLLNINSREEYESFIKSYMKI